MRARSFYKQSNNFSLTNRPAVLIIKFRIVFNDTVFLSVFLEFSSSCLSSEQENKAMRAPMTTPFQPMRWGLLRCPVETAALSLRANWDRVTRGLLFSENLCAPEILGITSKKPSYTLSIPVVGGTFGGINIPLPNSLVHIYDILILVLHLRRIWVSEWEEDKIKIQHEPIFLFCIYQIESSDDQNYCEHRFIERSGLECGRN